MNRCLKTFSAMLCASSLSCPFVYGDKFNREAFNLPQKVYIFGTVVGMKGKRVPKVKGGKLKLHTDNATPSLLVARVARQAVNQVIPIPTVAKGEHVPQQCLICFSITTSIIDQLVNRLQ
jgi:hypothetical protein